MFIAGPKFIPILSSNQAPNSIQVCIDISQAGINNLFQSTFGNFEIIQKSPEQLSSRVVHTNALQSYADSMTYFCRQITTSKIIPLQSPYLQTASYFQVRNLEGLQDD